MQPRVPETEQGASQFGEHSILSHLVDQLGLGRGFCIEFGAADGEFASNSYDLITRRRWGALLIEADRELFDQLSKKMARHAKVECLRCYVGVQPPNDLTSLLDERSIARDFDMLSIDIDGNDFHVWKSLESFTPKIVVVEFNPSIPPHLEFVQPAAAGVNRGSSFRSMIMLGREKGYVAVASTLTNVVFVREDLAVSHSIQSKSIEELFPRDAPVSYLIQFFDGSLRVEGHKSLLWHQVDFGAEELQVLPRIFRRYPGKWGRLRHVAYRFWTRARHAKRLWNRAGGS